MIGIKPHSHKQREAYIEKLIPVLQKKYLDNFLALGAIGSFARGHDTRYSDLELILFVKEKETLKESSIHSIQDGILLVIVFETKDTYIKNYLDVTDVWYASAGTVLLPLVNPAFFKAFDNYVPQNLNEKCLAEVSRLWPSYQEITAKVLGFCESRNEEALVFSFSYLIKELLILLSYLNHTPYQTLGSYIKQAKTFPKKPQGFNKLLAIFMQGSFTDTQYVAKVTREVFEHLEELCLHKSLIYPKEQLFEKSEIF